MKAEELMIGNWVNAHRSECVGEGGQYAEWEEYGKVKRIYDDDDTVMLLFPTRVDDWEEIYVKDLEPIPLTPEILEKNGFYYGYTSNEEDLASNTIAQLSEEDKGWVWDEGAGSVKVIIPNEADGGEIQICDQCFDRSMSFVFAENIMLHELQNLLTICRIKKEIEL